MKEKMKTWLYELWHGHPFLLKEEVDIICATRSDKKYKYRNSKIDQICGI